MSDIDNSVLHVTPTEASEFVEWALLNSVFDERTKLALHAFSESRRRAYAEIRENIANQYNDLRAFAHSRTPDQRESAIIADHKADKLDNVITTLKALEDGYDADFKL